MADNNQNNNQDWSNRNWQNARNFGNQQQGGYGGMFGNQQNNNDNNNMRSMFTMPGNNSKIGGNWLQGRNSMVVLIVVLIIVIIYTFYTQSALNASITKSTIERTKIETTFDSKTDECITDLGETVEDEDALRNAFKTFHKRTGVIPYLYIMAADNDLTSQEELDSLAESVYAEKFTDEDHFLVVIDPEASECAVSYKVGTNAAKVLDSEAIQIFKDYLAKFYADRQTNTQTFIVNTYGYTSERIMSTKNYSTKTLVVGGVVIIVLVLVIIGWIRKNKERDNSSNDSNNNGGTPINNGGGFISKNANIGNDGSRNYYDDGVGK